ncbi:Mediator of RNA polymerase II transcription subunit 6 [Entomortierella lignicola]|nr:Mediator of RNA polymerase II transcription subunit 6 [Entomortierella lignicola]
MATGISGAAGNPNNADQNLLNMEWRFHEWIMGVGGLNPDNVLDYFALSPFWDPECNNAVLRMQTQFNNLGEMKQRLRVAVDIAIHTVENREKTKQHIAGTSVLNSAGTAPGTDPKIKQESGPNTPTVNASTAPRNTPKTANKRRKKSEEASAAAASMGINTNVGAGATQGRPQSAGVQSAGPSTPGSTQPKRRKKTKTLDPK